MDLKIIRTTTKIEKWYENKGYVNKSFKDTTRIKSEDLNKNTCYESKYSSKSSDIKLEKIKVENIDEDAGCEIRSFQNLRKIKSEDIQIEEGLENIGYEEKYFVLMKKLKYETKTEWIPPKSPHNLVEEVLYLDPWALLVATIFLNRTSCRNARPYIFWFLFENPHPTIVLEKLPEDLLKYFRYLGLQNTRAHQVWKMTKEYLYNDWRDVQELYGIGCYGRDAYKMFCLGDFTTEPKDRFLRIYKAWYENIGRCLKLRP